MADFEGRDSVAAAIAGDRDAFAALLRRHYDRIHGIAWQLTGSRADADDIAQDVCCILAERLGEFRGDAKFTTWLYQIAHNLLVDQYRRARPEISSDDESAPLAQMQAEESDQPEQALSDFEQRRRLQQALEELPDDQRIALQLRLEQELPLEEIAGITGVGRETVKSRLRYALDKLKTRLS